MIHSPYKINILCNLTEKNIYKKKTHSSQIFIQEWFFPSLFFYYQIAENPLLIELAKTLGLFGYRLTLKIEN